ncbi:MAG: hypothetical protein Q8Q39_04455 [bacterium]|nr:hypothetical protein [bacterium]
MKKFIASLGAWLLGMPAALAQPLPSVPEPSITGINDFYDALKAIAQWILVFGIILGVVFIIIGGISILTSGGDQNKLGTGKKTITWAIVGVIVLILSYSIVNIIARFFGASGDVIAP